MEKLIVTCLLLLLVGGLSIGARQPEFDIAGKGKPAEMLVDSLPDGKIRLNLKHEGKQVEARMNEGAITYLKVDGKEIPAKDYAKYEPMLEDILGDMPVPPPPPATPAPPAPPAPGMPEIPDFPEMPDFPAVAPFWNNDIAARSFKNFNTHKDDKGNTVIEIEGLEGKPMKLEIDAKTGIVLLDGAPLEDGRTAVITDAPEAPFAFALPNMDRLHIDHRALAGILAEEGQLLRDQEGELRIRREDMKHMREEALREAMRAQEEAREDRREEMQRLRESQHELRQQALVQRELALAPILDGHIMGYFDKSGLVNGQLEEILEAHLLEDGLINRKSGYKMELTGEHLKVNGKKQPEARHNKYKRLYEDFSGLDLTRKSRIIIDTRKAE